MNAGVTSSLSPNQNFQHAVAPHARWRPGGSWILQVGWLLAWGPFQWVEEMAQGRCMAQVVGSASLAAL
jgi:hypothetical protein